MNIEQIKNVIKNFSCQLSEPQLAYQNLFKEAMEYLYERDTKLTQIENSIKDWQRGKYGFSYGANEQHLKDIRDILLEEKDER